MTLKQQTREPMEKRSKLLSRFKSKAGLNMDGSDHIIRSVGGTAFSEKTGSGVVRLGKYGKNTVSIGGLGKYGKSTVSIGG